MVGKTTQSVYRTAKGVHIDMLKIVNQNEMTIAVGNMGVNARGDQLGPGGKVVRKREEIVGNAAIPNQNNVREAAALPTSTSRNIKDMDPEGNE